MSNGAVLRLLQKPVFSKKGTLFTQLISKKEKKITTKPDEDMNKIMAKNA